MAEQRLVRVFVWKQGSEPARDYVRQVLRVAAPDAVPESEEAPLLVPVVARGLSDWPADFWAFALPQMRQPIDWTDRGRYQISGWQGSDSRTGEKLFVVGVYERSQLEHQAVPRAASPLPGQAAPAAPLPYAAPAYAPPAYQAPPPQVAPYAAPPVPPQFPAATPGYVPPAQPGPTVPVGYGVPSGGFPVAGPDRAGQQWGPPPAAPGYGQAAAMPPAVAASYGAPAYAPPAAPPAAAPYPMGAPEYAFPGRTGISPAEIGGAHGPFYAGFGIRLVAALLDFVIVGLLEVLPFILYVVLARQADAAGEEGAGQGTLLFCLFGCVSLFVAGLYFGGFWAARGQTPGMMVAGLKLVDERGVKPDFGRVMLRVIGYLASILTLGLGFLLIAFDERKQALHDRIAATFVVPAVPPATAPRPPDLPGYVPAAMPTMPAAPLPRQPMPYAPAQSYAAPPAPPPLPQGYGALSPVGPASYGAGPTQAAPRAELSAPAAEEVAQLPGRQSEAAAAEPTAESGEHVEDASALFRRGLALLEEGAREAQSGGTMTIEPEAARAALDSFAAAAGQSPQSAVYRYFVGVARRYAEGFDAARRDNEWALRLDANHWEARMQLYFGAAWHDAFAYPQWSATSRDLPPALLAARPQRPGARLALVREGGGKTAVVLATTRRASWRVLPDEAMPARIELVPAYSPYGLAFALYVAVRDNPQEPYRAETFLNPAEAPAQGGDATMLGQNLLLQLARQSHTYLIFVDEDGALLLNRRLPFDPNTRYLLSRAAADVQQAAGQAAQTGRWMPVAQFQQAAQWHMERFSLKQVQV